MSEPTKGPYRAGEAVETIEFGVRAPYWMAQIYDIDGQPFARIYGRTQEQAEAHARLLAAAWEMREVVEAVAGTQDGTIKLCVSASLWLDQLRGKARAALAKTDGKA